MNLDLLTADTIQNMYIKKAYILGIGVNFMNVFGVRASDGFTNTFNDAVGLIYTDSDNNWQSKVYFATTDPGAFYMDHPENVKGTAIVVPGQYIDSHIVGLHHGQYKALIQNKPIRVYRDNNKDDIYDYDLTTIDSGLFGINIHRASSDHISTQIDNWSAGCQVIASPKDFTEFMSYIQMHLDTQLYTNTFTYTLFEEKDMI